MSQKYEQWKESLPDLGWLQNLMPNEKRWQDFRESLMTIKDNMADKIEVGKLICNSLYSVKT